MTVKWAAAAAIGGALILTVSACATGPSAADASASQSALVRSVFLQQFHEKLPNATDTDDQAILVANDVCKSYEAGTSFAGEVTYLMNVGNIDSGEAGALIGMSTASFCPQFNDRH